MDKNETIRVDRHLYRVKYQKLDGRWSVYYLARFKSWDGKNRAIRLLEDSALSRKLLRELEAKNIRREDFDKEKREAAEREAAEEERANRLNIAKWLPLSRVLPDMRYVQKKGKRRGQARAEGSVDSELIHHGHLGDVYLDRLDSTT